jgi:hypothetical protein
MLAARALPWRRTQWVGPAPFWVMPGQAVSAVLAKSPGHVRHRGLGHRSVSAQWPYFEINSFCFSSFNSDSIQTLEIHINSNIAPKFMKPILLGF